MIATILREQHIPKSMKIGRLMIKVGLVLVVLFAYVILNGGASGKVITVDKSGGADYTRIQSAINAAGSGDTIFVRGGTYAEHIEIKKYVTLQGENKESTIIHGDIKISSSNVNIMRMTITNSNGYGILCESENNILYFCTIFENNIFEGRYGGIYLSNSHGFAIIDNVINNTKIGVFLSEGSVLTNITGNSIRNNSGGGIIVDRRSEGHHSIFHNNFMNNTPNAQQQNIEGAVYWDNGKRGNYWGDYHGNDTEGDGIGDTPYYLVGGIDRYPLMEPWVNIKSTNSTPGFEVALLVGALALIFITKKRK